MIEAMRTRIMPVGFPPSASRAALALAVLAYQQYRQQVTREAKFGTFGDLLAKKGLTNK